MRNVVTADPSTTTTTSVVHSVPDVQPKVRIEVPHGESIFTRVFLDGQELRYVTRVQFDTGDSNEKPWDKMARLTITLHASVELTGHPEVDIK